MLIVNCKHGLKFYYVECGRGIYNIIEQRKNKSKKRHRDESLILRYIFAADSHIGTRAKAHNILQLTLALLPYFSVC